MTDRTWDKVHIRDLRVRTHIGVADWEKKARQDIVLNITVEHDQRAAASSDNVEDTVSYKSIRNDLVPFIEDAHYELLESLAEAIADRVLSVPGVEGVQVTIDKPGALRFADSVAVEIHRR